MTTYKDLHGMFRLESWVTLKNRHKQGDPLTLDGRHCLVVHSEIKGTEEIVTVKFVPATMRGDTL